MVGNVWEWTSSRYDDKDRILLGSSWDYSRDHARVAGGFTLSPNVSHNDLGFRVIAPVS
jgi:formylglycine-generating enzyme required for sulfatase activity